MDTSMLTPKRQKMLIGGAAAALLLILGFSFAPDLELADADGKADVDDVLELVREDASEAASPVDQPRPFRRGRVLTHKPLPIAPVATDEPVALPPQKMLAAAAAAELQESPPVSTSQVVPPPYQQRLALLAEEEDALRQHRQRKADANGVDSVGRQVPTVTFASVEAATPDREPKVAQAVAESRDSRRLRQVDLVSRTAKSRHPLADDRRGAWLSGSIEIE